MAYLEVLESERKELCASFLARAVAWFRGRSVAVRRVMIDNIRGYSSSLFRQQIAAVGARHICTKTYTPRTNGKAERFIQTLLREWPTRGRIGAAATGAGGSPGTCATTTRNENTVAWAESHSASKVCR